MALQKQVAFYVIARVETFDGVNVLTEVTLAEAAPPPDAQPIRVVFSLLGPDDAAQFPTGSKVNIIVGADIVKAATVDPTPTATADPTSSGLLTTIKNLVVGNPIPNS